MPRLPVPLGRRGTLAAEGARRDFPQAIDRERAQQLKLFAANLAAARKFGPGTSIRKYAPPPEPADAVTRFHLSELKRMRR